MKTTRLYLSNDTSSRAAGAERLADAWSDRPEIQLIRTSSRGAFFLEPMVERDTPSGREAWFNVLPNDLPRIVGGVGGTPVAEMPFLQQQARVTFANFGITEPLALDEYQTRGGLKGLAAAQSLSPEAIVEALRISRLRGRGGAAFPARKKWQVAQQTNVLVCPAVWLCMGARSVTDKILATVFPITAFVACGFEHSVANMYFLPIGVVLAAGTLAPLSVVGAISNFALVTVGNVIGGTLLVALVYWSVYLRHAE